MHFMFLLSVSNFFSCAMVGIRSSKMHLWLYLFEVQHIMSLTLCTGACHLGEPGPGGFVACHPDCQPLPPIPPAGQVRALQMTYELNAVKFGRVPGQVPGQFCLVKPICSAYDSPLRGILQAAASCPYAAFKSVHWHF